MASAPLAATDRPEKLIPLSGLPMTSRHTTMKPTSRMPYGILWQLVVLKGRKSSLRHMTASLKSLGLIGDRWRHLDVKSSLVPVSMSSTSIVFPVHPFYLGENTKVLLSTRE